MNVRNFCDLLTFKTWANLRTEVSQYYLNYLWWVIDPILSMLVYYVVFGIMLNRGAPNFLAFLLCGLVPWQWFANTVCNASGSIYGNAGLFLQVDIPKFFFPLEVLLRDTFKNLLVIGVLLLFLLIYPASFVDRTWLMLPLLLGLQFLLNGGIALLVAAVVPFVPDLRFVVNTLVMLMMFISGIFFSIDDVVLPEHRVIAYLNPMLVLVKAYREILMDHKLPDFAQLWYVFAVAIALLVAGFVVLTKLNKLYPKVCLR